MVKVKRASFTPPIDVMPPSMGKKNSYTIPVPLEPVTIPTYYSSSITVARWYEVAGFNQEFGLQVQNLSGRYYKAFLVLLCSKVR